MKTSKIEMLLEQAFCPRYEVNKSAMYTALDNESVKGALVHFKDTDMNVFFNFTKDTISINQKTTVENMNKITEDYKRIKEELGDFPKPIVSSKTYLLSHNDCPLSMRTEMNMHAERKGTYTDIKFINLIKHDGLGNYDIKDIFLLAKSMFRMPNIFHYTVPKET